MNGLLHQNTTSSASSRIPVSCKTRVLDGNARPVSDRASEDALSSEARKAEVLSERFPSLEKLVDPRERSWPMALASMTSEDCGWPSLLH
ncbi:MAG: hypothetical protein L0J23_03360 [Bifidobacterium crudilactis]|nr:hypothetical protein [Bifidobacterium crudilactis]